MVEDLRAVRVMDWKRMVEVSDGWQEFVGNTPSAAGRILHKLSGNFTRAYNDGTQVGIYIYNVKKTQ